MADFERLIPRTRDDAANGKTRSAACRSSSFTRISLARLSQRLRRRGWTVGADDGGQDKENVRDGGRATPPRAGKHVRFDKRVYHGPVRDRAGSADGVRGILKKRTATAAAAREPNGAPVREDAVPNRMRMYDVPVTSFYIGAGEHLLLMPPPPPTLSAKRCVSSTAASGEREAKKTRRFGTDIGKT